MEKAVTNRRLLSLLLAFVLCLSYVPTAKAESAAAAVMRLMKTEGTVSISNSSGRSVKQTERMSLRSGYSLKTEESSYAWINLDDEKLVKMDAVSEITVRKSGKKLDILLDAGNLFFNVKSPLDDDEVFNVRTSTMAVGIRGTSGWVKVIDQWTSRLSVLEGTVTVCVTDPVTGETKTESVTSGETVDCKVYPQDTSGSKCDIIRGTYGERDIDGFVLVELRPDVPLCEKIKEESGIDIIGMPGKPADRLKEDQEQIRDKLQEIENGLERQDEDISKDKVWPAPIPDAPGKPATPPTASNPDSGGSSSGDSSGGGSGGGGGGGGSEQPAPSSTVTLTMPVEDDTISAYLAQSGVTQVILQPGTARSSSANMLEVDSGITVPGGKTLTLQSGVGLTILSGQQVAVGAGGRLTVGGVLTARGTLAPVQNAVIRAKRFDLTSELPDWIVSETADSSGYYTLEYSPWEAFTVTFDVNGGTGSPAAGKTDRHGRLASLPSPGTRTGYIFDGWYTAAEGGSAVDANHVYTGDTTLYAHWSQIPPETFTVTFNANGGSVSPTSGVTGEDGKLSSLPTPVREGYGFNGWFTAAEGGTAVDLNRVYTGDTTLYAHWTETPPETFTVTFDANGGSVSPGSGVTGEDGTLSSLPTLADWKQQASTYSELTHTFVGWYTQKIGGTKVTADTVFTEDTTIYAGWDWFYDESTKTLCIAGSGPMKDYVYEYQGSAVGWECTIPWMYTEDDYNMSHFDIDEIYITDGITHIGNSAFKGHGAKHVTIPNSVTSIGDKSFMQCNMTNVTIPASVTSIGSSAFESCSGLTSVTLPDSVTGIGGNAFSYCTSLAEVKYNSTKADWAALIPKIGAGNDLLLNATIICTDGVYTAPQPYTITFDANGGDVTPDSITTDTDGKLTSLPTLADWTQQIGDTQSTHTFVGWYTKKISGTKVTADTVFAEDTTLYAVWDWFYDEPTKTLCIAGSGPMADYVYEYQGGGVWTCTVPWVYEINGTPNSFDTDEIYIADGITHIGNAAFKDQSAAHATIPDSVTKIGEHSFDGCGNLTSVTIPNSVASIGNSAFFNCTKLTSVVIPNSVTSIGDSAFNLCGSLTDVTYNGTRAEWAALVPNIGASNDPLRNATITCTDGVYGTHTLTLNADGGLITIEGQSVGEYSIVTGKDGILPDLPEATKADNVFGGWYTADGTKLSAGDMLTKDTEASAHWYPGGEFWYYDTDAKTLHVTAELTGGVNNAPWKDYRSEMERVEIGGSVATIDGQMFRNYPKLRSVVISDSVTTITSWVFADCSALTALELPRSITIDVAAFQNCTNLAEVKYDGAIADWLALVPFIGDDNGSLLSATIHCSNGDYTATQYTITFNAQGGMFVLDGVEASVFSAIAISGRPLDSLPTARRDGYTFDGWYTSAGEDGTEVTKDTIFIEDTTLYAHWTANVQSNFDVASGTLTISGKGPMEAIDGYNTTLPWNDVKTDIIKVVIADGVTSIGNTAFQGCTGLAEVEIPASVTSIGTDAFALCNNLDNVYYGGSQEAWNTAVGGRDIGLNAQCAVHYESAGPDNPSSRSAYRVSNAASVYTDVPAGAWYAEAAEYCRTHNLMTGTSATTFTPDGTLTRAMMVTILHRLAGKPTVAGGTSFADVPAGKWYTEAISWANSKGIVLGYNASTFGLNDPVTHEQVGLILQRYSGDPTVEVYGKENPKTPATRSEIAVTLMAYAESRKAGSLSAASAMDVMCAPGSIVPMGDGSYLVADRYNKQLWQVRNRTSASYAGGPTVLDLYGQPLGGYNDGGLQDSYFKEPWAIAPFLDGWAVTDRANNAVRLVRSEAIGTLNTASAEKLAVTDLGVVFNGPTGLAADDEGNLYVADTLNGAVRRVSGSGGLSTVIQGLSDPMGLCWRDGVLYIAETGKNRILQLKDGKATVLAGSGSEGLTDGKGTKAAFSAPQGVAVGPDGSVYVADTGNGAVRVVKDGSVRTLAVRNPAQLSGEMISPVSLLLQENSLYICDTFARKIFVLPVQT